MLIFSAFYKYTASILHHYSSQYLYGVLKSLFLTAAVTRCHSVFSLLLETLIRETSRKNDFRPLHSCKNVTSIKTFLFWHSFLVITIFPQTNSSRNTIIFICKWDHEYSRKVFYKPFIVIWGESCEAKSLWLWMHNPSQMKSYKATVRTVYMSIVLSQTTFSSRMLILLFYIM